MGSLKEEISRKPIKMPGPSISSAYIGVLGTEQQDGRVLWRPYKKMTRHGGGGVRPIGMKKYPDARQAAVAYDEHVFREHGYDAVLNFDADNYRDLEERDRAETQAIQKERARRWHLVCLQKQGIITEDEMRSWIRSPLDN